MRFIAALLVLLVIISCSKEEGGPDIVEIRSTGHFPLDIGHIVDYQVFEVIYRQEGMIKDTFAYQLREEIVGSFIDEVGTEVYTVDRYTRDIGSMRWNYIESWQTMIEVNQVIRVEENRRYVKLRLPIRSDDVWDGNALFDDSAPIEIGGTPMDYYKNWQSKLIQINHSIELNDRIINNVHVVSLADYDNRLQLRYGEEIYADGIGLVHRELRIFDTQCFDECGQQSWEEKAEQGHIYIQSILN